MPRKRTDVMKDSPFRDLKGRMPLWVEIEAELGYLDFQMKQIAKSMPTSAIAKMIDDSTGFSESRLQEAKEVADRMIVLKKALEKETGKKAEIEIEEKIVSLASNA